MGRRTGRVGLILLSFADPDAARHKKIRVIDESGKDYGNRSN